MKASIYINLLEDYISNEFIENLFQEIEDPSEISLSIIHMFINFRDHGHWHVFIELKINGEILTMFNSTTNSEAVTLFNSEEYSFENTEAYQLLISECIRKNTNQIIEFISKQKNN